MKQDLFCSHYRIQTVFVKPTVFIRPPGGLHTVIVANEL